MALERFQHPRFARAYARMTPEADRRGGADHRRRLLAGLRGTVIEVGAGHGPNFAHYPPEVTRVLAVEPDDTLRALARPTDRIEVVAGHADDLPAEAASFDHAVVALVLCSVPDPARALREIARVLKPGGGLHYYEHVRSPGARGRFEDALTPIWRHVAGGCHLNRRTSEGIRAAGFEVEEQRFAWSPARISPVATHVLGHAQKIY